jgi:hypothetical protein
MLRQILQILCDQRFGKRKRPTAFFLPENLLKARTLVDTIVQDDQCLTVMTTLCTELDEVAAQVGELNKSQNPPSHCGHEGFR